MGLKELFNKISNWAKDHSSEILLFLIIFLLCLLSFGAGMLTQFHLQKPPLEIENVGE